MKNMTRNVLIALGLFVAFFGGLAAAVWGASLKHALWYQAYIGISGGIICLIVFAVVGAIAMDV